MAFQISTEVAYDSVYIPGVEWSLINYLWSVTVRFQVLLAVRQHSKHKRVSKDPPLLTLTKTIVINVVGMFPPTC